MRKAREIGWNEPMASAVRRRLPGASGRRRVREHLLREAERLAGKHVGRAPADQQARIDEHARQLAGWLTCSYQDRRRRLSAAIRDGQETHLDRFPTRAEGRTTHTGTPTAASRGEALAALVDELDGLLVTVAAPPGRHDGQSRERPPPR